jgi:hypothetical protein
MLNYLATHQGAMKAALGAATNAATVTTTVFGKLAGISQSLAAVATTLSSIESSLGGSGGGDAADAAGDGIAALTGKYDYQDFAGLKNTYVNSPPPHPPPSPAPVSGANPPPPPPIPPPPPYASPTDLGYWGFMKRTGGGGLMSLLPLLGQPQKMGSMYIKQAKWNTYSGTSYTGAASSVASVGTLSQSFSEYEPPTGIFGILGREILPSFEGPADADDFPTLKTTAYASTGIAAGAITTNRFSKTELSSIFMGPEASTTVATGAAATAPPVSQAKVNADPTFKPATTDECSSAGACLPAYQGATALGNGQYLQNTNYHPTYGKLYTATAKTTKNQVYSGTTPTTLTAEVTEATYALSPQTTKALDDLETAMDSTRSVTAGNTYDGKTADPGYSDDNVFLKSSLGPEGLFKYIGTPPMVNPVLNKWVPATGLYKYIDDAVHGKKTSSSHLDPAFCNNNLPWSETTTTTGTQLLPDGPPGTAVTTPTMFPGLSQSSLATCAMLAVSTSSFADTTGFDIQTTPGSAKTTLNFFVRDMYFFANDQASLGSPYNDNVELTQAADDTIPADTVGGNGGWRTAVSYPQLAAVCTIYSYVQYTQSATGLTTTGSIAGDDTCSSLISNIRGWKVMWPGGGGTQVGTYMMSDLCGSMLAGEGNAFTSWSTYAGDAPNFDTQFIAKLVSNVLPVLQTVTKQTGVDLPDVKAWSYGVQVSAGIFGLSVPAIAAADVPAYTTAGSGFKVYGLPVSVASGTLDAAAFQSMFEITKHVGGNVCRLKLQPGAFYTSTLV